MRGIICRVLAFIAAAGLALPVTGQVARGRSTTTTGNSARQARSPYTAEYKTTHVQTLTNGTTITRDSTEVKAVDSQGRRMTATTTIPPSGDQTPITHVNVFDPVARTFTSWSFPGKRATVLTMPSSGAERSCPTTPTERTPSPAGVPHGKHTVENLGTATIQGIETRGRRTSMTTPAGAIGNEAPLVSTFERWTAVASRLDGLVVREIFDDPRSGTRTVELVNLTQGEPDATTFQPPEGYEIVNKGASESSCPAEPATTN